MVRPIGITNQFLKIRWEAGASELLAANSRITVSADSSVFKGEIRLPLLPSDSVQSRKAMSQKEERSTGSENNSEL